MTGQTLPGQADSDGTGRLPRTTWKPTSPIRSAAPPRIGCSASGKHPLISTAARRRFGDRRLLLEEGGRPAVTAGAVPWWLAIAHGFSAERGASAAPALPRGRCS